MKGLVISGALLFILYTDSAWAQPPAPQTDEPNWGCYDARPGHPSEAEKRAFIKELAPVAIAMEQSGGPPAAGMLAMASLESGFGWTRTALFAKNALGYKFTGVSAADGRQSWALTCQPSSDENNRYIVFKDFSDCLEFVGKRLAHNPRYAPSTKSYHDNRAKGLGVQESVKQWVLGIASAGYNPDSEYPQRVLRIANDFLHPGDTVSSKDTLYQLSASTHDSAAIATSESRAGAERELAVTLARARYMSETCDPKTIDDWKGYKGKQVTRCHYSYRSNGKTLSALVYLLNPPASNIADRVADACEYIGLGAKRSCGSSLVKYIIGQNGAQFPVAGFVVERKQDAKNKMDPGEVGDDPVYLEFRDGTTIKSAEKRNYTDMQLTEEEMERASKAPIIETRTFARIANATRADYRRAGGNKEVGLNPASDRENLWPSIVRENELLAQSIGVDILLRGVAKRERCMLIAQGPEDRDYAAWANAKANREGKWTAWAESAVCSSKLPELNPADAKEFCGQYAELERDARIKFWVTLISKVAEFESHFDPHDRFTEDFNDSDGKPVISRGLLQLSMGDRQDPEHGCKFNSIQELEEPSVSIRCGVTILSALISKDGNITTNAEDEIGGARYWSVLRRGEKFGEISSFTRKEVFCSAEP